MIEKIEMLKGKSCSLTLKTGDSFAGVIQNIQFNEKTTALRIIFLIEGTKSLTIPITQIKSIEEIDIAPSNV